MPRWLPIAFNLAAIVCVVVATLRRNDVAIEGAYFNRAVGAPAYAGTVERSETLPWLVAASVLLLVSTALLIQRSRRSRQGP